MSALLPHLDASLLQERTYKENLSAQGFKGYGVIGPFNTFDARLQLVQKVIDLSALSKFKAVVRDLNAARYEREFARQKVVLLVSLNYLGALQAQGDFKAAEANLELSRELLKQTRDQFQAGLANSVDVARAETRLAQDEFRLASVRTSVHDAYLELQRSTGLPYDGVLKLMNSLKFIREAVPGLPDALSTARQERLDIRISQERLKASHYRLSEVKTKLLPQVAFLANYGSSGNDWNVNDHMTRGIMLQASMPIFDGGDISGQIRESIVRKNSLLFTMRI
jgi:outer membrane protein TolC